MAVQHTEIYYTRAGNSCPRSTVLILSQVFWPDPASVGQHMADVGAEMARRGHRVVVIASNRGYDDSSKRYPSREVHDGVEIRRLPFTHFGKGSFHVRLLGALAFMLQAIVAALFVRRLSCVLASTSPPMCGMAAVIIGFLRRVPFLYWLMDLNPDQMVAMRNIDRAASPQYHPENARSIRFLNALNRTIFNRAARIIVLDRFMADRIRDRVNELSKIFTLPPWPHEEHIEPIPHSENPFRQRHGLEGRFVVMYSGNHSSSNPVQTALDAALLLKDEPEIRFLFVGGGLEKLNVNQFIVRHELSNCLSLPYQPIEGLKYSLSAADVHLVSLGNSMVGILHPCKVYGAMACARPILFLGPRPSHITDILDRQQIGWQVSHGNAQEMANLIRSIRNSTTELQALGKQAQYYLKEHLCQEFLCSRFCEILESLNPLQQPVSDSLPPARMAPAETRAHPER